MSWSVQKIDGRWRFIGPNGPFFLRGVYAVGWDQNDPLFYREKYQQPGDTGAEWQRRWADATNARLTAWGFNAYGPYSMWDVAGHGRPEYLPYLHIIRTAPYVTPRYGGKCTDLIASADSSYQNWRNANLPDPFHPLFEDEVERYFAQPRDDFFRFGDVNDPRLMGIVMDDADNLFGFGPGAQFNSPRVHPTLFEIVNANKKSAAYQVLHSTPGKTRDFVYAFAKRYFSVVGAAIRRHVPGKLIFGPAALNQWGGVSRPAILNAVAEECDVVQVCISSQASYDLTTQRTKGAPLVTWDTVVANPDSAIGGYNPLERPQWPPIAETQAERGGVYRDRVRLMASLPNVCGSVWWSWTDHPGEQANFGLVSLQDEPYGPFVDAVTGGNAEAR